jgi:hypothetical protein
MASLRVKGGNMMLALQHAKEIAEFVTKYDGINSVDVFLDAFGETGTIRWFVEYEDLAALEKVQAQVMGDSAYWEKIGGARDLFIEGSGQTVVMRGV